MLNVPPKSPTAGRGASAHDAPQRAAGTRGSRLNDIILPPEDSETKAEETLAPEQRPQRWDQPAGAEPAEALWLGAERHRSTVAVHPAEAERTAAAAPAAAGPSQEEAAAKAELPEQAVPVAEHTAEEAEPAVAGTAEQEVAPAPEVDWAEEQTAEAVAAEAAGSPAAEEQSQQEDQRPEQTRRSEQVR